MTELVGIGVVHPWMCDAMGHLTTRHYMAIFDDASYELFRLIGDRVDVGLEEGLGWVDVHHEIDYQGELALGGSYHVRGEFTALGRTSLTQKLTLVDCATNLVSTTFVGRAVRFDLTTRQSIPIEDTLRATVGRMFDIEP